MYSNQRISGSHYPSHPTSSYPINQKSKERLNHWCDELDQFDRDSDPLVTEASKERSKILKAAPPVNM
ncbi:hypothetical protein Q7A53_18465 [Halobacillus rhizosphaerae]|uniref:hypothetical protein n=1 Tax=Halobacillus rhizosphaerae TaxID=3064889 RepID=UPI00398AFE2B